MGFEGKKRRVPSGEERKKEGESLNRRMALRTAGALLGSAGLNWLGSKYIYPKASKKHHRGAVEQDLTIVERDEDSEYAQIFNTQMLGNLHVAGLEAEYLGVKEGRLPEQLPIDYALNLSDMWASKIQRWEVRLGRKHQQLDPEVLRTARDRTTEYAARWREEPDPDLKFYGKRGEAVGRTTLKQAVHDIDQVINEVKSNINVEHLQRLYGLSVEQLQTVGTLAVSIDEGVDARGMLAAYSMTELFPRWDGEANARFYDFLLRTAGKEFLANIPSMGDPETSFGPLQFTSYALDDDTDPETGKAIRNGASLANLALPERLQLPHKLADLHAFLDHFKAGYLFALHNIAEYTRLLSGPELARFRGIGKENLLAFMAVSHNNPKLARLALDLYLARDRETTPISFVDCCMVIDEQRATTVRVSEYAQKTLRNFEGLRDYLVV